MPIYECRCTRCDNQQETRTSMENRYKIACTRCGNPVTIKPSMTVFKMAVPWSVLDGKGNVMVRHTHGGETEPLRNPDKKI